jgi:hypothetical protein
MNAAPTAKTPADLAREARQLNSRGDDAQYTVIVKITDAIIALDARLSSIETAARAPFDCSPADPGLSHPCGCEPTPFRYPADPISSPSCNLLTNPAADELWACLKLISDSSYWLPSNERTLVINSDTWQEVQRRAKALFPDRTL